MLLYWSIGHRIRTDVLNEKRAEYGQKILDALITKLVAEFGQGSSLEKTSRSRRHGTGHVRGTKDRIGETDLNPHTKVEIHDAKPDNVLFDPQENMLPFEVSINDPADTFDLR